MSKTLFVLSYCLLFFFGFASFIHSGSFRKDDQNWDIRVYKTDKKQHADLIIYEVSSFRDAQGHDALWKWSPIGSTAVSFTPFIAAADLVIYVSHNKKEVGWKRNHPLRGALR